MPGEHAYSVETTGWEPGNPDATAVITFRCPVRRCMVARITVRPSDGVPQLVSALVQGHAAALRAEADHAE